MTVLTSSSGRVRIAVLVPSTFLLDREVCEIASQRNAEAHIFRVSPRSHANPKDPESVADMVESMGFSGVAFPGSVTSDRCDAACNRLGLYVWLFPG